MTKWFHRDGSEYNGEVQVLNEGRASYTRDGVCSRCGGAGRSDKWFATGYVCYDCNGSGKRGTVTVKVYSAGKLALLNASAARANIRKAAKAEAKRIADEAASAERREAFMKAHGPLLTKMRARASESGSDGDPRHPFLLSVLLQAEKASQFTERQFLAVTSYLAKLEAREAEHAQAVANSTWAGEVGDRVTVEGRVKRVSWHEVKSYSGFGLPQEKALTVVELSNGSTVTYFGNHIAEVGDKISMKATVKELREFNGIKETRVLRPKVDLLERAQAKAGS